MLRFLILYLSLFSVLRPAAAHLFEDASSLATFSNLGVSAEVNGGGGGEVQGHDDSAVGEDQPQAAADAPPQEEGAAADAPPQEAAAAADAPPQEEGAAADAPPQEAAAAADAPPQEAAADAPQAAAADAPEAAAADLPQAAADLPQAGEGVGDVQLGGGQVLEGNSLGVWELFADKTGVSAMHVQLMPNNKVMVYDASYLGPSEIQLAPGNCRFIPPNVTDCFAHGVALDSITGQVRPLKLMSDPWCSSGGLDVKGELISAGGWADGERGLRYISDCDDCDFRESPIKLGDNRWYATQVEMPNAEYVLVGGRRAFNFEFVAPENMPSPGAKDLPFLRETTDLYENNLYPFVHLAPDGNIFIFANFKSILLDPVHNVIIRTFPDLPGGARNYPGSGSSSILPLKLKPGQRDYPDIEVLICGGADPLAFGKAENEKIYLPTLDSCGRMKFMQPTAEWELDTMPSPRVMGDMLTLPDGKLLMINGAHKGASGWTYAEEPNFTPVLYNPDLPKGQRFKVLAPSNIARMYHSTSIVLIDGKVMVAGSNTNDKYNFAAKFPTELRIEKFSPPYLDKELDQYRPEVVEGDALPKTAAYGQPIVIPFKSTQQQMTQNDISVVLNKPPFTTHGLSMNQRLVELAVTAVAPGAPGEWTVTVEAPHVPALAPPGHYIASLRYRGVPGKGFWILLNV